MQPFVPPPLPDARARYNRKWGAWLLVINTVVLLWLSIGDYLDDYFEDYDHLRWTRMVFVVPVALTLMAGAVALSLPKPLRFPFWGVVGVGLLLAVAAAVIDFIISLI